MTRAGALLSIPQIYPPFAGKALARFGEGAAKREPPCRVPRLLPVGRPCFLILWAGRLRIVQSGFMGTSSTAPRSPFPSGEGFRASHRSRARVSPIWRGQLQKHSPLERYLQADWTTKWWVRFILRTLRHPSGLAPLSRPATSPRGETVFPYPMGRTT